MLNRLTVLSKEIGPVGIWAGLGPRMVMTAGLVAGQFIIYGAIKEGSFVFSGMFISKTSSKSALHAPPGVEIHKSDGA